MVSFFAIFCWCYLTALKIKLYFPTLSKENFSYLFSRITIYFHISIDHSHAAAQYQKKVTKLSKRNTDIATCTQADGPREIVRAQASLFAELQLNSISKIRLKTHCQVSTLFIASHHPHISEMFTNRLRKSTILKVSIFFFASHTIVLQTQVISFTFKFICTDVDGEAENLRSSSSQQNSRRMITFLT